MTTEKGNAMDQSKEIKKRENQLPDIREDDFPNNHPYRFIVKHLGPKAPIVLAKLRKVHGDRLHLLSFDFVMKRTRERDLEKKLGI